MSQAKAKQIVAHAFVVIVIENMHVMVKRTSPRSGNIDVTPASIFVGLFSKEIYKKFDSIPTDSTSLI